jgi:betaine-aldehyde dehydrogenase
MPHGGVKAGGFGKDMSVYSLEGVDGDQAPISDITGRARKGWHGTVVTGPPAAPD